jgi:AcrR family transcriptional regulator
MARRKEQNQKIRDERREQILSKALMLFATRGLAATKISDIAKAACISQGLLYHYFKSKDEIFVELIGNGFERLNGACRWLEEQNKTAKEKIVFALAELLKLLEQNEDAARYHFLIAQATASESIPDQAREIIKKENSYPYEVIERILVEGQRDGSIKKHDPKELALVFWTTINGLAIYKAVHGKKFKAPNVSILSDIFISNNKN